MKKYLTYLLSIIFLTSCEKQGDCLHGLGTDASIDYLLPEFKSLNIQDKMTVYLVQDTVDYCLVSGPENLLDEVSILATEDTLYIENLNDCNFIRSFDYELKLYIHFTRLEHILFSGSGLVKSIGELKLPLFKVDVWGADGDLDLFLNTAKSEMRLHTGVADIHLSGYSAYSFIYQGNTNGFVWASDLNTERTQVHHEATGDVYVNANEKIGAYITGIGNVYYSGPATDVSWNTTGMGELIAED